MLVKTAETNKEKVRGEWVEPGARGDSTQLKLPSERKSPPLVGKY